MSLVISVAHIFFKKKKKILRDGLFFPTIFLLLRRYVAVGVAASYHLKQLSAPSPPFSFTRMYIQIRLAIVASSTSSGVQCKGNAPQRLI